MDSLTDKEKLREAEFDALRIKIEEEDRVADRIITEAEAQGGSIPMEELLGMPNTPAS